ncbi:tail fiber domain-containing protein [Amylibacter sp.]|nr:tail fiber domain-containing protein [Amylibacter sp.]MDB4411479.1 tail fiber domain-containing protein [bacterium]
MTKARDLADLASDDVLSTTSTGIDVTGTVTADAIDITESTNARLISSDAIGEVGSGTFALQVNNSVGSALKPFGMRAEDIRFATGSSERMRIDSSGNVGIGLTPSPWWSGMKAVETQASSGGVFASASINGHFLTNAYYDGSNWKHKNNGSAEYYSQTGGTHQFLTASSGSAGGNITWSERMRIDSSGNLLVGNTDASAYTRTSGNAIAIGDGLISSAQSGGNAAIFNRMTSDGSIVGFRKGGTSVGSIGVTGGDFYVTKSGSNQTGIYFNENGMLPMTSGSISDNSRDIGQATYRWDDIYATNGTIQTSDFNEKQDIASLTATEMLVGKRISALFKTFRWKDSVAEKGANARTHTGIIAQDVQAAFTAEGLDAGDYALFISSTWWETQTEVPAVEAVEAAEAVTETTTDEDGNEVVTVITEAVEAVEAVDAYTRTDTYDTEAEAPEGATSKTRMGIRYPELLSFVAAYNEQRFASIEARLTALEA